jgi:iron complex transport system substrate-binding protein
MLNRLCLIGLLCVLPPLAQGAISVQDDAGDTVRLERPARRVVSLAPHVTELLFAAGGAQRIVGTVDYSDYPPPARTIPRIGDNREVDIERLLALKPDLLVVWRHDDASRQIEQLRRLGIPLYYSDPRRLQDLPRAVLQLGQLMGTGQEAQTFAAGLAERIERLAARYGKRPPVRVFYQVWDDPLYTLNRRHIVSDAIRVCGGENIFAQLTAAAPNLSPEAVLEADPEAIVSGDGSAQQNSGVEIWKQYPQMLAVRRGNLFALDGDLMNRSGPRIVDGAAELCERLEQARSRRP